MAKQNVTLKVMYRDPRSGAINYPGETIRVSAEAAERLLRQRAAEPVEEIATQDAAPARATTAVLHPGEIKGPAKIKWLRDEITARGGEPEGRTIAALTDQLRDIDNGD